MRLLVIDHHDSYSHLLHHLFWSLTGTEPRFVAAEPEILQAVEDAEFDAAILSPGPGHPSQVSDFGATLDFLRRFPGKPMLGICLGHQGMAYACGAEIIRLAKPWHGKQSAIHHDGTGLFAGLPQGFAAVRYHSLVVDDIRLPRHLRVTARAEDDGSVQGISFTDRPWHGLQFHPESIGTALGPDLARSFLKQFGDAFSLPHLSPSLSAPPTLPPAPMPAPVSISLPTPVSPTPLFKALRSLAVERRWAHFWLDPQSTPALEARSSLPKAWPTTQMGFARHALELYPWGLALVECASQKQLATWEGDPLQGLEALRKYRAGDVFSNPVFAAYLSSLDWVGHLHYELGALCQDSFAGWRASLPPHQCLGCFLLPDCLLVLDAHENEKPEWRLHLAAKHLTAKGMGARDVEPIDADSLWQDILSRLVDVSVSADKTNATLPLPATSLSRQAYAQAFARVQEALHTGDTYEACLTFTCSVTTADTGSTVAVGPTNSKETAAQPTETHQLETHPIEAHQTDTACAAYLALRNLNPAPFGAFVATPKATLLSATPELFLSARPYQAGMQVASRPIKGTRARGTDPAADAAQKNDLGGSAKDRAENLMITDLVRNDLARICDPGSVHVTSLQNIETHPRVFQMVSEVAGTLRPGLGLAACLHATFPGGSMTGAPKLRTMQLLHELEGRPRGAYSGALGTLSRDGSFTLAMVIRTWVVEGHTYSAGCGGAIVTDSKEESEWQEALLKIDVLRQTLSSTAIRSDTGQFPI